MKVQAFLSKLQRVKASNGAWMSSCPSHGGSDGDKKPSLSIKEEDNKILLNCFAGCGTEAILSAMGLDLADLFTDNDDTPTQKRTIQHTYAYHDEDGKLLFEAIRYTPKGFAQRAPDGKGGWVYSLKGVRRVLYRLPELKTSKSVVVVEGEKDADACWKLGIPASTSPMGAGKWIQEYAIQLQKLGVVKVAIIPDNDPPGAAHALSVTASLQKAGIEVRLVPLPGVPEHGDLSDYLAAGHTREQLIDLIRSAQIAEQVTLPPRIEDGPDRQFLKVDEGRYRFVIQSSGIILEVSHLYRHRNGELNGELLAKVNGHFPDAKSYGDGILSVGDLMFSSVAARTSRAKLIAERSGDKSFDWYGALEEFAVGVITEQEEGDPPVILGQGDDLPEETKGETWDVDGLPILVDDPMVIFGDSASGKSFIALWIAGVLALRGIKVLYVDWEFSEREHRKRLRRLFQPTPKNLHYVRSDTPLIKEVQRLKRLIGDHGYQYLICDSIGFAVDGPAESHEAARGYFAALRMCGVGSLSLAHIAKGREDGREVTIFGSTFFRAGARSAWFVDRAAENPKGELNIGLHHRKANSSDLLKPLAYKLRFQHQRVIVERTDMATVEALSSQMPLIDRLKRIMQPSDLYSYKDLAEDLGVTADTIRKLVIRSKAFTRIGRKVKLSSQDEPPPHTDADITGKVIHHEF